MYEETEMEKRANAVLERLDAGETLEGEDAAIAVTDMVANETHGNYDVDLLHWRAAIHKQYDITITKRAQGGR